MGNLHPMVILRESINIAVLFRLVIYLESWLGFDMVVYCGVIVLKDRSSNTISSIILYMFMAHISYSLVCSYVNVPPNLIHFLLFEPLAIRKYNEI